MKKYLLSITLLTVIVASCIKDRNVTTPPPPPVNTKNDTLMYYWNFNTDSISALLPTFGVTTNAAVSYLGASSDTVQPGATLNGIGADTMLNASSAALRLRNPANGPFVIVVPTTGYKNIVIKYAEDHTTKGATTNVVTYTVNGGNSWKNTAISNYASYTIDSVSTYNGFQLFAFDFSSDDSVNNNANFQIMISFTGPAAANTSGNDRFDNITVYGLRQ